MDEPLSLEVFAADGTLDQAYTYHADHLGSIRFVTDSVGTIVNAYEYDSYGRPGFELEQVAQPFRYTGREWDQATELYHYRARQYDPETGKFTSRDEIGFSSGDFNEYRYVGNNPLKFTDPSGLTATERTVLSGNTSARSASGVQKVGKRINCLFGSLASVLTVAEGGIVEIVSDSKNCGARSISKKQTKRLLKTTCRSVAGGKGSQRKGQRAEKIIIEILEEVGFQIIESQTSFNVETGELTGKKLRPDGVTRVDKTTIALEFKAGKSASLRGDQKKKLSQFANLVIKFGCK